MRPTLGCLVLALLLSGCYQSATHMPHDEAPGLPTGKPNGGAGPSGAPGANSDSGSQGGVATPGAQPVVSPQ